jgi:NitT/TauT family transport system substrate-binding protein
MNISKVLFSLLLLAIGLVGCSPTPTAQSPQPVSLKVGFSTSVFSAIFQIATDQGYFAEQNLQVELVPVKNTAEAVPLLIAGQIDSYSVSFNSALFNAISQDSKLKILFPTRRLVKEQQDCVTNGILGIPEQVGSAGFSPQSLQGKTLGTFNPLEGSVYGYILETKFLRPAGLSLEDINTQNIENSIAGDALKTGQIDFFMAGQPTIAKILQTTDAEILLSLADYAEDMEVGVFVVGAKISDNPDVLNRLTLSMLKAIRTYSEGKTPANIASAVTLTGLGEEDIQATCWSAVDPNITLNTSAIMDYQYWLKEKGLLDDILPIESFYDPTYAQNALQVLGTVQP